MRKQLCVAQQDFPVQFDQVSVEVADSHMLAALPDQHCTDGFNPRSFSSAR